MPVKLLLFDIDGTLLQSGGVGGRAMRQAGLELFGERFRFEVNTAGMIDTQIYQELVTGNAGLGLEGQEQVFHDRYVATLEAFLREEKPAFALPGVGDLLATLRPRDDLTLGLLTGNYARAAPLKLRAGGIDPNWFSVTAFGDEAETRPALVPLALEKHRARTGERLRPEQVMVIGDTPKDIDCARVNGCTAFAVATGKYSVDELEAAGADIVVADLSDPAPLLMLL